MKTLILIRHIKSDWSNLTDDFDRPVREDRKEDAVHIAKEIKKKDAIPQLLIASPARRTMQTAEILADKWDIPTKDILTDKNLYEGSTDDILHAIYSANAALHTIAIVCHNPSITDFINEYTNSLIDNVPTTGAASISFHVKKWKDISAEGKLNWFLAPKELR